MTPYDAKIALWQVFRKERPEVQLDAQGYTSTNEENLIEGVRMDDVREGLEQGSGQELEKKFRAVHSSAAMVANCFSPFKRHLSDFRILGQTGFDYIQLEKQCPTGLRGTPPHLDVVVENKRVIIGIESKFLEYLGKNKAHFKHSYRDHLPKTTTWCRIWIEVMQFLRANPIHYQHLNAAQLVKHAFGIGHTFHGKSASLQLLYLYWEPDDADNYRVCVNHRKEIEELSGRLAGATPSLKAMSYADLWREWENAGAPSWLRAHIGHLRDRYAVRIDGNQ